MKIIKKTISDDEAFEKFFRDCYLRNLRPATVSIIKMNFMLLKSL
jgi:integrase/recombinase XerD